MFDLRIADLNAEQSAWEKSIGEHRVGDEGSPDVRLLKTERSVDLKPYGTYGITYGS